MDSNPRVVLYFDPASHHFLGDRLFDSGYAGHAGDQILAPYAYLKSYLEGKGIEVHTADLLPRKPDGSLNVYVSSGRLASYRRLAERPDVVVSAFFAMECPTVEPGMYRELNRAQHVFKRIYSWSDSKSLEPFVGGSLRCLPMKWPQSFDAVHEHLWNRGDRGFLVMLNSNKLPRHKSPCRELYSERLRGIEYFGRTGEIDLYGNGWDGPPMRVGRWSIPGTFGKMPMPGTAQRISRKIATAWHQIVPEPYQAAIRKAYRGYAASKLETLSRYTFSLCFENSVLKGWITEKIFDCFFAGAIPIYWGAPDIGECVPKDCFIDMREFKDYDALRKYLKSMGQLEIRAYKESAREFIGSPRFQPFTKRAFAELFEQIVQEDTGIELNRSSEPATSFVRLEQISNQ